MGVRNYMRKRQIKKLENERDSITVVQELEKLQREIGERSSELSFDEEMEGLKASERQFLLEQRIKKLKAKGLR